MYFQIFREDAEKMAAQASADKILQLRNSEDLDLQRNEAETSLEQ